MKVWSDTHRIRYAEDSRKVRLFQLTEINKPTFKVFPNESLSAAYGHVILLLAPYYPELSPIQKTMGNG
jgi:hypothetical protein